tara:strand:+ start:13847 stop:14269 length:423 start_codon:yes stop_codon:yes gene_type:complete
VKKTIIIFGSLIISLLVLFQLGKYSIASGNLKTEFVIAVIALVFFFIGLIINNKSNRQDVENSARISEVNTEKIEELGITSREHEILIKISEGFSNKEIADQLFVSESTIKSHVSNLFIKLDVKRRTQAVKKAKTISIIT